MRAALPFGLVCAVLAAALALERRFAPPDVQPELAVQAFSRGESSFPAPWPEQGLRGELSIGDADLSGPARTAGLRVATISPARAVVDFESFDVAGSASDVDALIARCRGAEVESALVVCAAGAVSPREERSRAQLAELFAELGASAPPLESPSPAWALLALRRPGGWIALAESRGEGEPTRLSFLLRRAGFEYERRAALLRVDGAAAESPAEPSGGSAATWELASSGSDGRSGSPSLSADGRCVAFASDATALVAGDRNGCEDVFVRDRAAATTERASVADDGSEFPGPSLEPSLSADGRRVAFRSRAAGERWDVFVRDRERSTTRCLSVATSGAAADAESSEPAIAGDGSCVVFASRATNLVAADANAAGDVFVADLARDTLARVSLTSAGAELDGESRWPALSADGRTIVFASRATNVDAAATSGAWRVYVHERASASTVLVSPGVRRGARTGDCLRPAISADARWIAFESEGGEDAPQGGPRKPSILVHDRESGRTRPLALPWPARQPQLDGDGRFLACTRYFPADAGHPDDPLGHVYRVERESGRAELVDALASGEPAEPGYFHHTASRPAISRDGAVIALTTACDALVPGDSNGRIDVAVRALSPR